jgi:hypothetical protein
MTGSMAIALESREFFLDLGARSSCQWAMNRDPAT